MGWNLRKGIVFLQSDDPFVAYPSRLEENTYYSIEVPLGDENLEILEARFDVEGLPYQLK